MDQDPRLDKIIAAIEANVAQLAAVLAKQLKANGKAKEDRAAARS